MKEGSFVQLKYECELEDGTVIDSSSMHAPIEFEIGTAAIMRIVEKQLMGSQAAGRIRIGPIKLYGEHSLDLVQDVPRKKIGHAARGSYLIIRDNNGANALGRVVHSDSDIVRIDLNHPLAGKDLYLDAEVNEII